MESTHEWKYRYKIFIWFCSSKIDEYDCFHLSFVYLSAIVNNGTEHQKFPMLRWHQNFDVGYVPNKVVPKVFMPVTLDLCDDPTLQELDYFRID